MFKGKKSNPDAKSTGTKDSKESIAHKFKNAAVINKLAKLEAKKKGMIVGGIVLVAIVVFMGIRSMNSPKHTALANAASNKEKIQLVPFDGISEFDKHATGSAIGSLQSNQSQTNQQLHELAERNDQLSKSLADQKKQLDALKNQIINLNSTPSKTAVTSQAQGSKAPFQGVSNQSRQGNQNMNAFGNGNRPVGIGSPGISAGVSVFSFNYSNGNTDSSECKPDNCVLPGSFVKAVLIGAADADASVDGQSNTTPILFKIMDKGTLPNNYHSNLKGCMVVGEVYGDISSERGEVKLVQISCIKDGKAITKSINGIAVDIDGKEGIGGSVVSRNGKVLFNAGLSGIASGTGNVLSQMSQTQVTSPSGTMTTMNGGQAAANIAGGGMESAMGKLSDYYIKLANQYHPIIQLTTGTNVDLVFLSQFTLTPEGSSNGASTVNKASGFWQSNNQNTPKAGAQNLSNLSYGSTVNSQSAASIQQQIQALGGQQ